MLGRWSSIGDRVDVYSVDRIIVGEYAVVSQEAFLCTATHDFSRGDMPLVTGPITVEANAWIAARVIVLPGVVVGEGAIIGAGSTVTHSVTSWTIAAGVPARRVGDRARVEVLE